MKHTAFPLVAFLCTGPLWAQELAPGYASMGTMTATVGGTEYRMVIPYDIENDSAYAER